MTQTPDDRTPVNPREERPPLVPSTRRAKWPWVTGGAVLALIVIVLLVLLLTPDGTGQLP
jgi:hypothetical protein